MLINRETAWTKQLEYLAYCSSFLFDNASVHLLLRWKRDVYLNLLRNYDDDDEDANVVIIDMKRTLSFYRGKDI